jgi:hypothetical protein
MNELEFIKHEFLKDANPFSIFKGDSEVNRAANIFQYQFGNYIEKIKEATSIDEVKDYVQKSRIDFLEQWKVAINEEGTPYSPAKAYLQQAFFSFNLNTPEKWFESVSERFQQKTKANFFEKIKDGLNFIQNKLSNSNEPYDKEEILQYSHSLIQKYNLASIDLSGIKPNKAMDFLKTLDKNAQHVCDNLGVTTDVLGIHGTLSFVPEKRQEAFFRSERNSIHLGFGMKDSSTILHEWVHALDYHIGNKIIPGSFATDIENSVFIDDSDTYKAFKDIKSLSQEIFSSNPQVVDIVKQELFKEGTAKFWNDFLGDDSYLLPNNIREKLQSKESFTLINNFLSQPNNKESQSNLINFIQQNGLSSPERINFINNPDSDSPIFQSKPFFDNVNKNIITNKSAYYLISNLSNFTSKWTNIISEKIIDLFSSSTATASNVTSSDYLTQPVEMIARYFESQVFNKKANLVNASTVPLGIVMYKITKDDSFEDNKNKIISTVFGKDKILSNLEKIRLESNFQPNTSQLKM